MLGGDDPNAPLPEKGRGIIMELPGCKDFQVYDIDKQQWHKLCQPQDPYLRPMMLSKIDGKKSFLFIA